MGMLQKRNIQARSGFTFIEIVIVMLMMGIMMASAAPKFFDSQCFHSVDTAASRVKADLEWARRDARMKSKTHTVSFSPGANTYVMSDVSPLNGGTSLGNLVDLEKRYSATVDAAVFGTGDAATSSVQFNAFGSANLSGSITVSSGGHSRVITVAAGTGVISIQ